MINKTYLDLLRGARNSGAELLGFYYIIISTLPCVCFWSNQRENRHKDKRNYDQ